MKKLMTIWMLTIENFNLKVDNQNLKLKYARLSFTFIKSLLNKVETVEAKPDPKQNSSRSTNIAEVNNSVNTFIFYQVLKTNRQIPLYGKQRVKVTLEICKFSLAKMHKVVFVSFPKMIWKHCLSRLELSHQKLLAGLVVRWATDCLRNLVFIISIFLFFPVS